MTKRYFQSTPWPPFVYGEHTYDLSHLDEYSFSVVDSSGAERIVAVTFGDHCFTEKSYPGADPDLIYLQSDRRPGYFSLERYNHSLNIREHIVSAVEDRVWMVDGESTAIIPTVDQNGVESLYAIVFDIKRVSGTPANLRMLVVTAYPCTEYVPVTYGNVRFRILVTLAMQGKSPTRIRDHRRRQPGIRPLKRE